MIEEAILHHVETVGVRQRVIRLAQVPFSGEIGFVTALLKHRRERPLRLWQAAALTLESHGGHAAAIRKAPRNHGSAPRGATWLGIEREERQSFVRHAIQVRRRHAATRAATIYAGITVSEVIGDDEDNVGF